MVGTVADPKVIFACALKAGACGIILAHNLFLETLQLARPI